MSACINLVYMYVPPRTLRTPVSCQIIEEPSVDRRMSTMEPVVSVLQYHPCKRRAVTLSKRIYIHPIGHLWKLGCNKGTEVTNSHEHYRR